MDHTYEVYLVDKQGKEFKIYGPSKSLEKARNIALRQAKHRKVKLYRNNKLLPNGRFGLDVFAYEAWSKEEVKHV